MHRLCVLQLTQWLPYLRVTGKRDKGGRSAKTHCSGASTDSGMDPDWQARL